jgi:ribonucleoside-diphosphate reductase alpha chain
LKSLYYCRSKSIQRAEVGQEAAQAAGDAAGAAGAIPHLGSINGAERPNGANGTSNGREPIDYDECLACQ